MAGEDSWVFDSLVCFLHGPIWNAPLQTFIEEKSLVFDPNLQLDESDASAVQIHEEYKHLVDYMLGSFMEELQISPEQFELACLEGGSGGGGKAASAGGYQPQSFHFHQGLFQQIWAANDIKIFIRMMTQRNVELQLQALDLIEKNQLAMLQPESGDGDAASIGAHLTDEEMASSLSISGVREREWESPDAALTPENDENATENDGDDDDVGGVADKFERLNLFFERSAASADDMSLRQEYLRQQRDKILEVKKSTRAKLLAETVARQGGGTDDGGRPTSALVAQRLLENGGKTTDASGGGTVDEASAATAELNTAMQLRKTLAKRLRAEVVEQK